MWLCSQKENYFLETYTKTFQMTWYSMSLVCFRRIKLERGGGCIHEGPTAMNSSLLNLGAEVSHGTIPDAFVYV